MLSLLPLLVLRLVAATDPACNMPIEPVYSTDGALSGDPDDPAIWRHRGGNSLSSRIIGTDKGRKLPGGDRQTGKIDCFRSSGHLVQSVPLSRPNNVDVEYGVAIGGETVAARIVDIAVTCDRGRQQLRVFSLSTDDATCLTPIDGGGLPVFVGNKTEKEGLCMGVGLYKRPPGRDYAVFVILSRKQGRSGRYLWQYRLEDRNGDGVIEARKVREFGEWSGVGEIEAVAVDDMHGTAFYSDEECCIRAYAADPSPEDGGDPAQELSTFGSHGFAGDREGISLYKAPALTQQVAAGDADVGVDSHGDIGWGSGSGLLIVSNQAALGDFRAYCRRPPHHFVGSFQLAGTNGSDGSEATSTNLGPGLESGAFVAMSDSGHGRFNIYRWLPFFSLSSLLPLE